MNDMGKNIGTVLVILLLITMAGCSGDSDGNNVNKTGSLSGSGK